MKDISKEEYMKRYDSIIDARTAEVKLHLPNSMQPLQKQAFEARMRVSIGGALKDFFTLLNDLRIEQTPKSELKVVDFKKTWNKKTKP